MSGASVNGKSYWDIGKDGDQQSQAEKIEFATKVSIERFQRLIQILVELKDTQSLLNLQAVTLELYRRADECLSQGKTMTIKEEVDHECN